MPHATIPGRRRPAPGDRTPDTVVAPGECGPLRQNSKTEPLLPFIAQGLA